MLQATPNLSTDTAEWLAKTRYELNADASVLPSERDQNFLLETAAGDRFVLKIANGLEDPSLLAAQNEVMEHLARRLNYCPRVVPAASDELVTTVKVANGLSHFVRLVTYLPGRTLATYRPRSHTLLFDVGQKLGRLDRELASFEHPALYRNFHWDLAKGTTVVADYHALISNPELRTHVLECAEEFETTFGPLAGTLRRGAIHGDANDYNLLVDSDPQGSSRLSGIIDFGDMIFSYTVADLAVAIAYAVLGESHPLQAASHLVSGYSEANSLYDQEIEALLPMVKLRLCMSVCLAAYQQQQQPDNRYLEISQQAIRETLPILAAIDPGEATAAFYKARRSAVTEENK